MKKKTVKKVKKHKLECKSQEFAQSQKICARSHDRETVTFRNSATQEPWLYRWLANTTATTITTTTTRTRGEQEGGGEQEFLPRNLCGLSMDFCDWMVERLKWQQHQERPDEPYWQC